MGILESLEISLLSISPEQILAFFLSVLLSLIAAKICSYYFARRADRSTQEQKHVSAAAFSALSRSISFLLVNIGLKVGFSFISLSSTLSGLIQAIMSILIVVAVAYVLYELVDAVDAVLQRLAERTESKLDNMLAPMIRKSLRITIIVLALLQITTILSDKPPASIIAGLGVSGLAIALAGQDTIKNFFGAIVLLSDRPFEIGDRVQVDGIDGSVEEVGFRSTRIRTLDGHLATLPNGELANKDIVNVAKRPNIKCAFDIGVTYDTPHEKVQLAVDIVKKLLDRHEGFHPDLPPRVFFKELGASSLNIGVLFWYHPAEYWDFIAFREKLNFELIKSFEKEGIEFAFPTQTIYLADDAKRGLSVEVNQS